MVPSGRTALICGFSFGMDGEVLMHWEISTAWWMVPCILL